MKVGSSGVVCQNNIGGDQKLTTAKKTQWREKNEVVADRKATMRKVVKVVEKAKWKQWRKREKLRQRSQGVSAKSNYSLRIRERLLPKSQKFLFDACQMLMFYEKNCERACRYYL